MATRFDSVPEVHTPRSMQDLSHRLLTTMELGKLYPLDCVEVLPGDTWITRASIVVRTSSSFVKPIMDNIYYDIRFFFVPCRLTMDSFDKVFGDDTPQAFGGQQLVEIPTLNNYYSEAPRGPSFHELRGTIADYMGVISASAYDVGVSTFNKISVLPFRGFALIWNYFYRNENIQTPVSVSKLDTHTSFEKLNADPWSPQNYCGQLPPVCKDKDYFTSCYSAPQKGKPITIRIDSSVENSYGYLPISGVNPDKLFSVVQGRRGLWNESSLFLQGDSDRAKSMYKYGTSSVENFKFGASGVPADGIWHNLVWRNTDDHYAGLLHTSNASGSPVATNGSINATNMVANAGGLKIATVEDLRLAFLLQKRLERDMFYGSRYAEYVYGAFGVIDPDFRAFEPEYLGGSRNPIYVEQVAQTSAGTETSALGDLGGYSLSNGDAGFVKSVTEHGYIFCCGCMKQRHSYQFGMSKMFTRVKRDDFYDPLFANIGCQPVYLYELNAGSSPSSFYNVFGYQEPWAEYRYLPDRVTGQMRSKLQGETNYNSLDIWHLSDTSTDVRLNSIFIEENNDNVNRVLTVKSEQLDPFIFDIFFDCQVARAMPSVSIPRLEG